jgi:arginase
MSRGRSWEIVGAPFDAGSGQRGSGKAPSRIRSAGLSRRIEHLKASGFRVTDVGDVPPLQKSQSYSVPTGAEEMLEYAPLLMERIEKSALDGNVPVILGGDHSVSIPAVSAVADVVRRSEGSEIGVLWIDAHPDLETPGPDSTDDLHAMAMSHLLDRGVPELRALRGFAPKVKPENLIYLGLRNVVPEEHEAIHELSITSYTMSEIERDGIWSICEEIFGRLGSIPGGFVVSLDIDAIDPLSAPGVDYPEPGGLSFREAMVVMEFAALAESLRLLEVVEVNPLKDRDDTTSLVAARLICRGIKGPAL